MSDTTTSSGLFQPLEGLAAGGVFSARSGSESNLQPLTGSGQVYEHCVAADTFPMLTIATSMMVGGAFNAAPAFPRLTGRGYFGALGSDTFPALTGQGTGTVNPLFDAALTFPLPVGTGHVLCGTVGEGAATFPTLTFAGSFGFRAANTFPAMTGTGSATAVESCSLAATFPALRGTGSLEVFSYPFSAADTFPMLIAGGNCRAALVFPALTGTGVFVVTGEFEGWVLNLRNKAVTRLTNFPFTQFVNWNGMTLAVAADGLYQIGGDTDNGDVIDWEWQSGLSDLDAPGIKHIPYLYMDGIIDGEVEIVMRTDDNRTYVYNYDTSDRGAIHKPHRRKLGQGIRTRNVAFGMRNGVKGAYIEIDSIEPEVTVTQRSI